MLADVKKQLLCRDLALAPSLLASPSQSWRMSSRSTKQASPKTSSVLKPICRWRPERPCSRAEECWHLTEQNEMYEAFIVHLAIPADALPLLRDCDPAELTPERSFQIQLLLIHFYRRVVLKDPLLPEELLPA